MNIHQLVWSLEFRLLTKFWLAETWPLCKSLGEDYKKKQQQKNVW